MLCRTCNALPMQELHDRHGERCRCSPEVADVEARVSQSRNATLGAGGSTKRSRLHCSSAPSLPPTANQLPSGENETTSKERPGPRTTAQAPDTRDHTLAVPSSLTVAATLPSGEIAAALIGWE